MQYFQRSNKVTGVYYSKKSPEEFTIKIILKPQNNIVAIPKFEEFNNPSDTNIDKFESQHEVYSFKWQEKVFNTRELQYYSERRNCVTDNEIQYHETIKSYDPKRSYVFTYVNEDNYRPSPFDEGDNADETAVSKLAVCLDGLSVTEKFGNLLDSNADSRRHLFRSEENFDVVQKRWISMHIMLDHSKYNDDDNLTIKQEAPLLSLYWSPSNTCLVLKPDTNSLDWNPYLVESSGGVSWNYQYAVELDYGEDDTDGDGEEFKLLLRKLQRKWDRKHQHLFEFAMPPAGVRRHYFTLDIVSASNFEMDNLYIDYNIKIPDDVTCEDPLRGRTHTTRCIRTEEGCEWCYSHQVDLQFECQHNTETPTVQVFLEVISCDWWGRERTEGYAHLAIALDPGDGGRLLSSVRPEEIDRVEAESRRFFLGGCHLLKNVDVLASPQEFMNPNYKNVSSGSVSVRWHTVRQSSCVSPPAPPAPHSAGAAGGVSAVALLRGADAVLRQYRRARARLEAATQGLEVAGRGG